MLDDHRDFERNLRRVLVNLPRVRQSVFYYAGDVVRPIPEVTNHRDRRNQVRIRIARVDDRVERLTSLRLSVFKQQSPDYVVPVRRRNRRVLRKRRC